MAKEKHNALSVKEGHIVVKNKKFKISDIVMFLVCVVISLVIWIYATNVEEKQAKDEAKKLAEEVVNKVEKS